jgi:BCD family chlorophyll transporter-like MFS transporter
MQKPVRIANNIRLALFPMAYALSGVLIGSTLNRVMIAELGYSATLVAFFFAIPLMISPIRVWVGYRSDAFPLLGKRREPYIILGALLIGLGIIAIVGIITRPGGNGPLMAGVASAFLLYGLGRNTAHTTFQALVADRYTDADRSRAATLYEVATMLGMVAGAGFIKKGLAVYEPARLTGVALGVAVAVFVLALFATIGNEEQNGNLDQAARRARETPFRTAFAQVIAADPQVRLFFVIVMLTFIGTLAQDVLLEPYGGLVLGMSVGETTGLIQYWGVGVLLAMLASGLFLLKRCGWMITMRVGMILSAAAFVGPIGAGLLGSAGLLTVAVFVMGVGTGLAGAGMLSGTLSFTSKIRAGMLLGVWAVANMAGHAFGSLLGGVLVDTVRHLTHNPFLAYSSAFATEVIMLVTAVYLSARMNYAASQAHQEEVAEICPTASGL